MGLFEAEAVILPVLSFYLVRKEDGRQTRQSEAEAPPHRMWESSLASAASLKMQPGIK